MAQGLQLAPLRREKAADVVVLLGRFDSWAFSDRGVQLAQGPKGQRLLMKKFSRTRRFVWKVILPAVPGGLRRPPGAGPILVFSLALPTT